MRWDGIKAVLDILKCVCQQNSLDDGSGIKFWLWSVVFNISFVNEIEIYFIHVNTITTTCPPLGHFYSRNFTTHQRIPTWGYKHQWYVVVLSDLQFLLETKAFICGICGSNAYSQWLPSSIYFKCSFFLV